MNMFDGIMESNTTMTRTQNGAVARSTTGSKVYDMFALGGAYRGRSDADVINLFRNAFAEDPTLALKCLFYLRDVRGGQGERRFFRVAMKDLAAFSYRDAKANMALIPEYGRWDDLYTFVGTRLEKPALEVMKTQFMIDLENLANEKFYDVSVLAKWLKSENTSSAESKRLAKKTRDYFGISAKRYRKALSALRENINIVERLMSAGKWDEIEFDKIPSGAGIKYKKAFARHDIERMASAKPVQTFAEFVRDDTKKMNAGTLYPYEIIRKIPYAGYASTPFVSETDKLATQKLWDNLEDYFKGNRSNILCVCDTSASMTRGYNNSNTRPMDVAIGLTLYTAERNKGDFHNKFVLFSSRPHYVTVSENDDIFEKTRKIMRINDCSNTDLIKTFDLILDSAKRCVAMGKSEDIPKTIVVISDMQIDQGTQSWGRNKYKTDMELVREKWAAAGLICPNLVYWNVDAKKDTILDAGPNVTLVSGCSPAIFRQVITKKTGYELMIETLNTPRYAQIKRA